MNALIKELLPWMPPLAAFSSIAGNERHFVFLYSGLQSGNDGRYSYLAIYPEEISAGDHFSLLDGKLANGGDALENAWFGYFGYELLHDVENLAPESESHITLPGLWFARFGLVLVFDHHAHSVTAYRKPGISLPEWSDNALPPAPPPLVQALASPMTRDAYLAIVNKTREAIVRGDFYQANITRKFTGTFAEKPDAISIFRRLMETSPSVFSAVIRIEDAFILSSSPESFLKISSDGRMESSPVKGTAPRFADKLRDEKSREYLASSEKERAENLMIVDLMRNDFSRSCVTGSVRTQRLFEISSYATLHHMASTVLGQKRANVSTLEAIKNCFPPGSMTGAPKIQAMKWCMAQERIRRGVYSGALGWLGGNGSCELSVVIRTLIIQGDSFEFQVGGGITSGSDTQEEWQETITKARGIMAALGLDVRLLESI